MEKLTNVDKTIDELARQLSRENQIDGKELHSRLKESELCRNDSNDDKLAFKHLNILFITNYQRELVGEYGAEEYSIRAIPESEIEDTLKKKRKALEEL